jgi:hypothetical protein
VPLKSVRSTMVTALGQTRVRGDTLSGSMMSGMRRIRLPAKTPPTEQDMRFNAPPAWPTPPAGWTPVPGWQPDPSWGPVPSGWQLWVAKDAVAGWPPPDVKPSRLKVAVAIGLCVVVWVGGFVGYALVGGDPGLNEPIAALVQNGGTEVDVAMSSCRNFEVIDVRIVAVADAYGYHPGPDQLVWDSHLADPSQRVFHLTAAAQPTGGQFKTLTDVPVADSLFAEVDYVQTSAPKGFTDRSQLTTPIALKASDSDRRSYDRALAKRC